jgi:hypothetical protein
MLHFNPIDTETEQKKHSIITHRPNARYLKDMLSNNRKQQNEKMTALLGMINHGFSLTWFKMVFAYLGPNAKGKYLHPLVNLNLLILRHSYITHLLTF